MGVKSRIGFKLQKKHKTGYHVYHDFVEGTKGKFPDFPTYDEHHLAVKEGKYRDYPTYKEYHLVVEKGKYPDYLIYEAHHVAVEEGKYPDYPTYQEHHHEVNEGKYPDHPTYKKCNMTVKEGKYPDYQKYKKYFQLVRAGKYPDYQIFIKNGQLVRAGRYPDYPTYEDHYLAVESRKYPDFLTYEKHHHAIEAGKYPDFPTYEDHNHEVKDGKYPDYPTYGKHHGAVKDGKYPDYPTFGKHHGAVKDGKYPDYPTFGKHHEEVKDGKYPDYPTFGKHHGAVKDGKYPDHPTYKEYHQAVNDGKYPDHPTYKEYHQAVKEGKYPDYHVFIEFKDKLSKSDYPNYILYKLGTEGNYPNYLRFKEIYQSVKDGKYPDYPTYEEHHHAVESGKYPNYNDYIENRKAVLEGKYPDYNHFVKFYVKVKNGCYPDYTTYNKYNIKVGKGRFPNFQLYMKYKSEIRSNFNNFEEFILQKNFSNNKFDASESIFPNYYVKTIIKRDVNRGQYILKLQNCNGKHQRPKILVLTSTSDLTQDDVIYLLKLYLSDKYRHDYVIILSSHPLTLRKIIIQKESIEKNNKFWNQNSKYITRETKKSLEFNSDEFLLLQGIGYVTTKNFEFKDLNVVLPPIRKKSRWYGLKIDQMEPSSSFYLWPPLYPHLKNNEPFNRELDLILKSSKFNLSSHYSIDAKFKKRLGALIKHKEIDLDLLKKALEIGEKDKKLILDRLRIILLNNRYHTYSFKLKDNKVIFYQINLEFSVCKLCNYQNVVENSSCDECGAKLINENERMQKCAICDELSPIGANICRNCSNPLYYCEICKKIINSNDLVDCANCLVCNRYFHRSEIETNDNICPVCKLPIEEFNKLPDENKTAVEHNDCEESSDDFNSTIGVDTSKLSRDKNLRLKKRSELTLLRNLTSGISTQRSKRFSDFSFLRSSLLSSGVERSNDFNFNFHNPLRYYNARSQEILEIDGDKFEIGNIDYDVITELIEKMGSDFSFKIDVERLEVRNIYITFNERYLLEDVLFILDHLVNLIHIELRIDIKPNRGYIIIPNSEYISKIESLKIVNTHFGKANFDDKFFNFFKNLTHLSLENIVLEKEHEDIIKSIFELSGLLSLKIDNLEMFSLPKGISNLSNLIELFIASSKFKQLPKDFMHLKYLETIYLNSPNLETISGIEHCQNLKFICIKAIRKNPFWIYSIEETSSKFMNKIPKEIFSLINLERLDLFMPNLTDIPRQLLKLKNLNQLNLYLTNVKIIPGKILACENINLGFYNNHELNKSLHKVTNREIFTTPIEFKEIEILYSGSHKITMIEGDQQRIRFVMEIIV